MFKLKSFELFNNKSMGSSESEVTGYIKDLEVCRSQDKIKNFYEHCQSQYDCVNNVHATLLDIQNYAANLLKEFLCDENALILDVACGVGDAGKSLQKAGFSSFHGADASLNNIQKAKDKNIYSKLYSAFVQIDERLPCSDDLYDGILCIGNLFRTHMPIKSAIQEFCRVLKPGGYAVFTFDDLALDSRDLMSALGDAMFKRKVEVSLMEKQEFINPDNSQTSCY